MIKPDSPFMRFQRILECADRSNDLRNEHQVDMVAFLDCADRSNEHQVDMVAFLELYQHVKRTKNCSDGLQRALRKVEGNA